jgi:oligopeptide transport system permease protein
MTAAPRSLWLDAWQRFARNRAAVVGLIVITEIGMLALFAPWVDRYPPDALHTARLQDPSPAFWLGTDALGRDQYSRLVHGARVSLAIGVLTQVIAVALGLTVGMAAGLGGRKADTALMRLTDIAYAFPDLLLIILLVALFGHSVAMLVLAIALVSWMTIARIVRGQVLSLQHEEYVVAARAMGASTVRIAWRHLLPNVMGPVIVAGTFGVPAAIFAEAALSFVGFGLPLGSTSWGQAIDYAHENILAAPYLALSACLAVAITTISFSFIGDGLRDALDPRSAARRPRSLPDVREPTARPAAPHIEREAA